MEIFIVDSQNRNLIMPREIFVVYPNEIEYMMASEGCKGRDERNCIYGRTLSLLTIFFARLTLFGKCEAG